MPAEDLHITERVVIPSADLSYEYARSSGPGGQHVNTTETAVRLRFQLARTMALHPAVKERVYLARTRDVNSEGELLIHAERFRSRQMNIDDARDRLAALIRGCLVPPKPRKATKPTKSSQRERVEKKRSRSGVKAARGRVRDDD